MNFDATTCKWHNPPKKYNITHDRVIITTDPETDFWQNTYYGFQNINAPALLASSAENFTFTVKTTFEYKNIFDQSGIIIYIDDQNWFKASIEYEDCEKSKLGSVVTNTGYSDWATQDIATPKYCHYRLSRRGSDFLLEYSFTGKDFTQLRIFHLSALPDTQENYGNLSATKIPAVEINFGIYACSPTKSSFTAEFSELSLNKSCWKAHFS